MYISNQLLAYFVTNQKFPEAWLVYFFGDSQNFQKHFYVFQPEKLDIRYHRFSSDTIGYHVLPSSGPQAFEATNSDNVVFV